MAGKRLAPVTPLAIQDKREYGHRCDQQDAEYDGPNQRRKRSPLLVMVCRHRGLARRLNSRTSAFDALPIFSRPASIQSSERCALPYSHGRKRLAEWLQYQVQPGPMQPVSSAIWPAFWDQVSSQI
jgi:hypothetical protein